MSQRLSTLDASKRAHWHISPDRSPHFLFERVSASSHRPSCTKTVAKRYYNYEYVIICLLASVDVYAMPICCACSLIIVNYRLRPEATRTLYHDCTVFSRLCQAPPESGLVWCHGYEGLCRRNCTAVGSSLTVRLYSVEFLGKYQRLTFRYSGGLTLQSKSQRNSSQILHLARHGKSPKDQKRVSLFNASC